MLHHPPHAKAVLHLLVIITLPTLWPMAADKSGAHRASDSWPQFRGLNGSGIGQTGFPVHFGPDSNVVWKTPLPPGNSSPCISGDRIFLTAFWEGKLSTLCLDRTSGRILWQQSVPPGNIERGAQLGSPATATPATDGERVWVYFGSYGLVCYDVDGREIWRKPLPVPITQHGAGSSPVVAGDRLFMLCDQDLDSHLMAVNAHTGETLWRTDRPHARRGFSTPLLHPRNAPAQVIVAGTLQLVSYDVATGRERWHVNGLPNEMVASPVEGDGLVFVAGWTHGAGTSRLPDFDNLLLQGDQDNDGRLTRDEAPSGPAKQHFIYIDADKDGFISRQEYESIARIFERSQNVALAVRPDGTGDVTESHVAWSHARGLPYCPSPLFYEGRLYLIKNGGLATCLDAGSGRVFYQEERVGALGDYYASPVAGGGRICVISQPGVAVILRAGDTLEILARNTLDETVIATPAIVDGNLYVRTAGHLYAFGERAIASANDTADPGGSAPP